VIDQREMFVLLNIALTDNDLLDRIDGLAEALTASTLYAVSGDGDTISELHLTATGRATLLPTLPMASA
jgi:hypothetical protein